MSRLADYFCIIGVEDQSELEDGKELKSHVIQKFPENDWKDTPSPQGLEHFCQPSGWFASLQNKPPTFNVAILTDMEGKPSYLACLTFQEAFQTESFSPNGSLHLDLDFMQSEPVTHPEGHTTTYYVPKCLCLISRHRYYNTLRNCLTTIFVAYLNNSTDLLEKMIGCMLGCVHVPPPGGPKLKFTIGGGDSQVLQPPLSGDLPSTNESVAVLFNQLGINSIIHVFTALATESKILLLSSSYTYLTMAAEALISLLYPLHFNYVFIPVLPSALLDFLSAPTPFLMGVHASYEDLCPELYDIVIVNIDEGYVTIPDSINLCSIPEPYYSRVLISLKKILTPSLFTADNLFPSTDPPPSLALQDKELRAVFIKFFAELFCGYRSCLTLIRVHPEPVISFNRTAFMEKRGVIGDEFFSKVLDSVGFSVMTHTRGPPFRVIDQFDELVAKIKPSQEEKPVDELLNDLIPIVDHLCQNEPEFDNPEPSTIPEANAEVLRKPLKLFPLLNEIKINSYLNNSNSNGGERPAKAFQPPIVEPQCVPISTFDHHPTHYINQRRLEVIQDCIQYIYDGKISEARKALPSVLRALKSKGAQLALCNELELRVKSGSAMLDNDQYNLIIRLINAALQDDNTVNSITVASKMIPLAAAFHRILGPSVIQFAYTSVQEHSIWSNMKFWEEAFYADAQRQIVELHVKERRKRQNNLQQCENDKLFVKKTVSASEAEAIVKFAEKTLSPNDSKVNNRNSMFFTPTTPVPKARTSTVNQTSSADKSNSSKDMPDPMALAADLLAEWDQKSEKEQQKLIYEEEGIIFSLTMLFANRMMYLRVPTNACAEKRKLTRMQEHCGDGLADDSASISTRPAQSVVNDAASTYMGESVMGGSSSGWGSVHDLTYGESVKDTTTKFILRFVERVCIEAAINPAHLKSLQNSVPKLVDMHIESLNEVYRETKDAPTQKAKILKPVLLDGEEFELEGLRCYLIKDGRELGVRSSEMNPAIPSDSYDDMKTGAAIGGPCLMPAEGALFLTNYRVIFKGTPVDQFASEMTVTRSFPVGALLKEKKVQGNILVYSGQEAEEYIQVRSSTMQMMKLAFDEEVSPETIENFRKQLNRLRWPPSVYNTFAFNYKAPPVLQRTLSQRQQSIRKTHRTLSNVVHLKKKVGGVSSSLRKHKTAQADDSTTRTYESVRKDSFSSVEDDDIKQVRLEQENRSPDRLMESALCRDYERLGFGSITKTPSSVWRLSMANFHYTACRSYPAIVVSPHSISDDALLKVAKNHRANRFPVAVWRHKKTKGTLLRSGAINKSVLTAVLRAGGGGRQAGNHNSNVTDDEKLFTEIVKNTQPYLLKGKKQTVSAGAAFSMRAMSDDFSTMFDGSDNFRKMVDEINDIKNWVPALLYIFVDKATSKISKFESSNKVVVVNVEIHDLAQVKISFQKLSKVCCPSSSEVEQKFLSLIEECKWMSQISSLLQIACSIVNLIDIQGSSCLISFGDGTDVTAQVVSLVQILSDPYYRTIEGFKVLVEKDWLAFGYRFSYRGSHVASTQAKTTFAPFFLQFLDCVHQILLQYPHAFEFNNYFLKFIAYHQTSMRFNTFFLDSEHERYQHGWFPDSEPPKEDLKPRTDTGGKRMQAGLARTKKDSTLKAEQLAMQHEEQKKKKSTSVSLWDYLNVQSSKFTLFQSFSYHPNLHKNVLQPFCNISNLEIWDFYTTENLYTGPTYDLELISDFEMANPGNEASITAGSNANTTDFDREDSQRCLTGCYGSTSDFPRDEATYLLSELSRLKEELDQKTQQWRETWDNIDNQNIFKKNRTMQWQTYWAKERKAALHKRAAIDMVMKGKITDNSQTRNEFGFEYPHAFVTQNFLKSSICNYCLLGIKSFHSGLRCSQCGYNVHEKCQSMVPAQCPKHASLIDQPGLQLSRSSHSISGSQSNPRNFKGTLYKRGHLLKNWKPRWFVLDAEKNSLTYYNSEGDSQLQGYVDLGEMRACRLVSGAPPHAPKVIDPRSYFELETTKRVYLLFAPKEDDTKDWVERLRALNV